MSDSSTNFTYTDPHTFEGEPHEAAAKASEQAGRAFALAALAATDAENLARNAWMTRNIRADGQPNAAGWDASQEGQDWALVLRLLGALPQRLASLAEAAGQKDHA